MPRIPLVEKDNATPEVRAYFQRVASWLAPLPGPRAEQAAIRVPQPWRAFAHSPTLAEILFQGSSYILTELPWATEHNRLRQFVILAVIRRLGCEFAYLGHWPTSQRAGIGRELFDQFSTVEGLEAAKTSALFTEEERLLIQYADDLARTGNVSKERFDEVLARYGPRGAVEITAIIGYRMLTSVMINAFDLKDD